MPSATAKPRTLYDKVFQDHIVDEREDGTILLYIGMGCGAPFEAFPHRTDTVSQTDIWSMKSHLPKHSKA
jgi:hypothetical protein